MDEQDNDFEKTMAQLSSLLGASPMKLLELGKNIEAAPTEWHGDALVTAEKTVQSASFGHAGVVTVKGEIRRDGVGYRCKTEVIFPNTATAGFEMKEPFASLDEAKRAIIEAWPSQARNIALKL